MYETRNLILGALGLLVAAALAGPAFFRARAEEAQPATPEPQLPLPAVVSAAPTPQARFVPADDLNLRPPSTPEDSESGEQLIYDILWNGLPAGKARMQVKRYEPFPAPDGPLSWNVKLEIRSSRALSAFYRVRTKSSSVIDGKGGFSRSFHLERKEGEYRYNAHRDGFWAEERIEFDYTLGEKKAEYRWKRHNLTWAKTDLPLTDNVLDPLAALYYLRSKAVVLEADKPEGVTVLPICTDKQIWNIRPRLLRKEKLSVAGVGPAESCLMIKLETQAGNEFVPGCGFNGLFERRGEMTLWLHEATRVLVKAEVELPIGPCEVRLVEHRDAPFPVQQP